MVQLKLEPNPIYFSKFVFQQEIETYIQWHLKNFEIQIFNWFYCSIQFDLIELNFFRREEWIKWECWASSFWGTWTFSAYSLRSQVFSWNIKLNLSIHLQTILCIFHHDFWHQNTYIAIYLFDISGWTKLTSPIIWSGQTWFYLVNTNTFTFK